MKRAPFNKDDYKMLAILCLAPASVVLGFYVIVRLLMWIGIL